MAATKNPRTDRLLKFKEPKNGQKRLFLPRRLNRQVRQRRRLPQPYQQKQPPGDQPDETAAAESPAAAAEEVGPNLQEEPLAVSPAKVKRSTKRKYTKEDVVKAAPEEPVVEAVDEPLSEVPLAGEELRPDELESVVASASEGTAETAPAEAGEPGGAAAPTASKKRLPRPRPVKNRATCTPQADVSPEEQGIRGSHALLKSGVPSQSTTMTNQVRFLRSNSISTNSGRSNSRRDSRQQVSSLPSIPSTLRISRSTCASSTPSASSSYPTKAIGTKTAETVLKMMKRNDVSKLLYSAGTRLPTFVPAIELLARIYLELRKKEDIIPGDRLTIQAEVLMKYSKGPSMPRIWPRRRGTCPSITLWTTSLSSS